MLRGTAEYDRDGVRLVGFAGSSAVGSAAWLHRLSCRRPVAVSSPERQSRPPLLHTNEEPEAEPEPGLMMGGGPHCYQQHMPISLG
jgi:hypothetical protein